MHHLKIKTRFVMFPLVGQQNAEKSEKRDKLESLHLSNECKTQRNYTTNLIRKKKKLYIPNLSSESKAEQTKKLWQVFRNTNKNNTNLDMSSKTDTPKLSLGNALNKHFVNISRTLNIKNDCS